MVYIPAKSTPPGGGINMLFPPNLKNRAKISPAWWKISQGIGKFAYFLAIFAHFCHFQTAFSQNIGPARYFPVFYLND